MVLLDDHRSRLCALPCYELGLTELVGSDQKCRKGTEGKDKSNRTGLALKTLLSTYMHGNNELRYLECTATIEKLNHLLSTYATPNVH
jgi:hypothetical protein